MIDDGGVEENIPLPEVNKVTLLKVIDYCTYIKDNAAPEIEKVIISIIILNYFISLSVPHTSVMLYLFGFQSI